MSNPKAVPSLKITDLPLEVRSHIVSFLAFGLDQGDFRDVLVQSTLDYPGPTANHRILSKDLLSAARSSVSLSDATAYALGPAARHLTLLETQKTLPDWITVLSPMIKAVTCYVPSYESYLMSASDTSLTLKALSGPNTAIEVLDLRSLNFPFDSPSKVEYIDELSSALERSSSSLRELALPLRPICAKALKTVNLTQLKVLHLEFVPSYLRANGPERDEWTLSEAFLQMLRCLDGHADRSQKLNTVYNLQLRFIAEAPCIDIAHSGCSAGLFGAVTTLKLASIEPGEHEDSLSRFIGLFSNLECLVWLYTACKPNHLRVIGEKCAYLKDLHLSLREPDGDLGWMKDTFQATQGKLRTLKVLRQLTVEELRVLGEKNPNLECLIMSLGHENVGGLLPLLGSHCRSMQKLKLKLRSTVGIYQECLGAGGWRLFAEAICSSSEDLQDIMVSSCNIRGTRENAVGAMIRAIVEIVEFVCPRARQIDFRIAIERGEQRTLVEALCRILAILATRAKHLEWLRIDFQVGRSFYWPHNWDNEEQGKELLEVLAEREFNLREQLPQLRMFSLGEAVHEALFVYCS